MFHDEYDKYSPLEKINFGSPFGKVSLYLHKKS